MDKTYWPFDVRPESERSDLENKKIKFLESALLHGCRSFKLGSDNYGAEKGERMGELVWRGRKFVEVQFLEKFRPKLEAYVDIRAFDIAGECVIEWANGQAVQDLLESLKPYLYRPSGAHKTFRLEEDF